MIIIIIIIIIKHNEKFIIVACPPTHAHLTDFKRQVVQWKKRYSRETRRVVLHTLMFFLPHFFFSERLFRPFGIFVSAYFFRVSQSIDTLCADASMCYRSVQASTIYSYLFCSSPVLHIYGFTYAVNTREHSRNVQRECNIDHDNVFHSRQR